MLCGNCFKCKKPGQVARDCKSSDTRITNAKNILFYGKQEQFTIGKQCQEDSFQARFRVEWPLMLLEVMFFKRKNL